MSKNFPKLGILASGNGSNMEAIFEATRKGELEASIQVVLYNNPGAGVANRAERLGIPYELLDHRGYPNRAEFDSKVARTLQERDVEWVIMAGWMRIATANLLKEFSGRILNIHPSLLPKYPGMRAIEQALEGDDIVSGCTVHFVELEVDSGPIIMQTAVPILEGDTPEDLQRRIQIQEHLIYPEAISKALGFPFIRSRL